MKTKNAFAFRNWDSEAFRKKYAAIIDNLTLKNGVVGNAVKPFNEIYALKQHLTQLKQSLSRITRHTLKISGIRVKIAVAIANYAKVSENAKDIFRRSDDLYHQYVEITNVIGGVTDQVDSAINYNYDAVEEFLIAQFARNLKAARVKANMSQPQFARKAMMSTVDISNFENGKKTPAFLTLAKLANALNVTTDELVFGAR